MRRVLQSSSGGASAAGGAGGGGAGGAVTGVLDRRLPEFWDPALVARLSRHPRVERCLALGAPPHLLSHIG